MQAEAEGVVALHDDFRNECAAQLCVGVVEEVRSILQQGYQLPRPLGGGIPLGIHKLLFVQLGLPELTGQFIAFGYKNVRINEAVLLEEGQRLMRIFLLLPAARDISSRNSRERAKASALIEHSLSPKEMSSFSALARGDRALDK